MKKEAIDMQAKKNNPKSTMMGSKESVEV